MTAPHARPFPALAPTTTMPTPTPVTTANIHPSKLRVARAAAPPYPPKNSLPPFRAPALTSSVIISTSSPGTAASSLWRLYSTSAPARRVPATPGQNATSGVNKPAGAEKGPIPTPLSYKELPSKYKPAERKVRAVIIALPVAIVTSWVLYERLFLGQEQKVLVPRPESQ
jgi:hypothetical protein